MNSPKQIIDIKEAKIELNKIIIESLKNGTVPKNPNSFVDASTIVQEISDRGEKYSEALFEFHNITIQKYIEDCYKIISKESSTQLIDSFIKQTEKIDFLIYWMNLIFTYLDRFFTRWFQKPTLSKKAISLYKEYLFNPLENIIYVEVNKLIEEDRNYNIDSRPKIKTILKILYDMDLSNPKIVKQNNIICWIQGKEKDEDIWYKCSKNETIYQDKWYKCFKDETIKFAKDKGNADIKNMSATQYIMSQLKYIDEETIRQREYINPKYHDEINKINYKYLIEDHSEELTKMDMSIPFMLTNKKNEELKKTFQLLKETGRGLDYISDAFMTYINKRGEEIGENKEITKD